MSYTKPELREKIKKGEQFSKQPKKIAEKTARKR
jgi:hypothetical protein